MSKLVFDIETIGRAMRKWIRDTGDHDEVDQKESYNDEEYQREIDALKDGLGFSPLTGQIVAIGVMDVETSKGAVYYQNPDLGVSHLSDERDVDGVKLKVMSEPEMLEKFWEVAKRCSECISFNGRAFDVPFLMVRSAIHKIRVPVNLMPNRYASNSMHLDLLDQLSFYGSVRRKGNLHMWCRAFGIKSPKADGISGDDVGALFKDKQYEKIAEYNIGDLKATAELYKYWNEFMRF